MASKIVGLPASFLDTPQYLWSLRWLNQSTHSQVATPTRSAVRHGQKGLISSVLQTSLDGFRRSVASCSDRGIDAGLDQSLGERDRGVPAANPGRAVNPAARHATWPARSREPNPRW